MKGREGLTQVTVDKYATKYDHQHRLNCLILVHSTSNSREILNANFCSENRLRRMNSIECRTQHSIDQNTSIQSFLLHLHSVEMYEFRWLLSVDDQCNAINLR